MGTVLFHHAVGDILGVNVTDMECLALIVYRDLASPSEIARYTGLGSGATTAMLDRLESSQLIERRPNPKDRRGVYIVLTGDGKARLNALFGPLRKSGRHLVSTYTNDELDILAEFLDKIAQVLKEEQEKLQKK